MAEPGEFFNPEKLLAPNYFGGLGEEGLFTPKIRGIDPGYGFPYKRGPAYKGALREQAGDEKKKDWSGSRLTY